MFMSLYHSPQSITWHGKATNSKKTCLWSYTWQEQGHRVHGSLANNHGNIELNVNRLTATLSSNFGARYEQSTASYKCNQGHGWIEHDMYNKTSLVNISSLCLEWLVEADLHGIKITAEQGLKSATSRSVVCMLVLATTLYTKIQD